METTTMQYSVSAIKDLFPCTQYKQYSIQPAHLINGIDWSKQAALFTYKSCIQDFSELSQSLCEHIYWSLMDITVTNACLISKGK